ncbi:MAG: carotenoid 1,2-hydratase [Hyphomicrobium sp.]|nr:carotenoid 1,2-hydratase [Hyphomicrobium sp.]
MRLEEPCFDADVPPGGYAWWYVDGVSDDGRHAITLIAFLGSVFSPYYAWSGRHDPLDHSALNVALYGAGGHRWAMTERGREAVSRNRTQLAIGPSRLDWDGKTLRIAVNEMTVPFPSRIRGEIRIHPEGLNTKVFALDHNSRHDWHPIAPSARIEVDLEQPSLSWNGRGYFDINRGSESLEAGFDRWDWARASLDDGSAVLYDVTLPDGAKRSLALRFDHQGNVDEHIGPEPAALPKTLWRVERNTRADIGHVPRVLKTLEDTPFYSRSMLSTRIFGEDTVAMHESLSLNRFRMPLVKAMLPFRMPRRAGRL